MCADERVADILRTASARMLSPQSIGDLGKPGHMLYYPCTSPFCYAHALARVGEGLAAAVGALNDLDRLANAAHSAGATLRTYAGQLRRQYDIVVAMVRVSPLFVEPTGDLSAENQRLLAAVRLLPLTARTDCEFQQYCAARAAAVEALRDLSAAHALVADIWAVAVEAINGCLEVALEQQTWDTDSTSSVAIKRDSFRDTAQLAVKLVEGAASEALHLTDVAARSKQAGRMLAGQLWAEAANAQLQMGSVLLANIKSGVSCFELDNPRNDCILNFVRKASKLAQVLDYSEARVLTAETSNDSSSGRVSHTSQSEQNNLLMLPLLKASVEHSRVIYAAESQLADYVPCVLKAHCKLD